MSNVAADITVEVAFGYGVSADVGDSNIWTDITDYVVLNSDSTAIASRTGRDGVRAGISPGTLSLVLDNKGGRFDSRNAAGPYYGNLKNYTPIRITTTYGGSTENLWTGYISGGWPQDLTQFSPTVTVEATDVFGVIANSDAPLTAFDAVVSNLNEPPDRYIRSVGEGWLDTYRNQLYYNRSLWADRDPIINGGEGSYGYDIVGQYEGSEGGFTIPEKVLDPESGNCVVLSFWFRAPDKDQLPYNNYIELFNQLGTFTSINPVAINIARAGGVVDDYADIFIYVIGSTWRSSVITPPAFGTMIGYPQEDRGLPLYDGNPHLITIVFQRPPGAWANTYMGTPDLEYLFQSAGFPYTVADERMHIFVDGEEPRGAGYVYTDTASRPAIDALLVGRPADNHYGSGYVGTIDNMMIWDDYQGTIPDLFEAHKAMYDAGRFGWSNERLDERIQHLAGAFNITNMLGTVGQSGIKTLQSYRQSGSLELIQRVEDTEQGWIYVGRDGKMNFIPRSQYQGMSSIKPVVATFSDVSTDIDSGAVEMLDEQTVIVDDYRTVYNSAQVTSEYGRMQTFDDRDSIKQYGRQGVHLSGLLHSQDAQSMSLAKWLVDTYKEPKIRAERVSFLVENNPAVYAPLAQTVEEGDMVLVRKIPYGGGAPIEIKAYVIGVEHSISWSGWQVTLYLDSSTADQDFFVWGISKWDDTSTWAF